MINFHANALKSAATRARWLVAALAAGITTLPAAALAQTAPSVQTGQSVRTTQTPETSPTALAEITVTGTLIRAPNVTSDSPIQSLGQADIQRSNVQSVNDLLNRLPAVTTGLTVQENGFAIGASTVANVDLRGMGPTRTLVLIDGHRLGPGDPNGPIGAAADLNFIPLPMVQGVDVLTGGAAAVYGSDAVAGVVNFHLLNDFEGVQVSYSGSVAQHSNDDATIRSAFKTTAQLYPAYALPHSPSSTFDGSVNELSIIAGINSSDHKGNVTLFADDRRTSPVQGAARDWDSCPASAAAAGGRAVYFCGGSSWSQYGNFPLEQTPGLTSQNLGTMADNPDGSATFVKFTPAEYFNYQTQAYLQSQDERTSLGTNGHYNFNSHAQFYSTLMYMRDTSEQQDAAGGIQSSPGIAGTLNIPCTNPYIGQAPGPTGVSQYDAIGCGTPGVTTATIVFPSVRFTVPRQDVVTHNDYLALAGLRGGLGGDWTYDASFSHWQSDFARQNIGYALLPSVNQAMQNGTLNIFQYGGDTVAQQQAVAGTSLEQGGTRQDDAVVSVSGDLGQYGGTSPLASKPINVAGGVEYRRTSVSLVPDANYAAGYVLGQPGAVANVNGTEAATEEYAEVQVPLANDKPLVHSLNTDLAFRHSGYTVSGSSTGFSTNTFKIGADYAPVNDFRLRGSFNRAARAPNVFELTETDLYSADRFTDPCAGTIAAKYLAACTDPALGAAAILPGQLGQVPTCAGAYCNALRGGNEALQPETANTWTWGFVFTPRYLHRFYGSVDYWDIRVSKFISNLTGSPIVNGCYGGITYYCQFIHRDPVTGSLFVGTGAVNETEQNFSEIRHKGVDVDLRYTRDFSKYGSMMVELTGTYLLQADTQFVAGTQTYDCAGLFGLTCGVPLPKWRHQMSVTWESPWNAYISAKWRYIGHVSLDADDPSNPAYGSATSACGGVLNCGGINSSIGSYSYIDLSGGYTLWDRYTLRLGVNNLMDKDPPVLNETFAVNTTAIGANGNTYNMYDVLGRVLYVNLSAKW